MLGLAFLLSIILLLSSSHAPHVDENYYAVLPALTASPLPKSRLPMTIRRGGVYSGLVIVNGDPCGPAIKIETDEAVVIKNSRVSSCGMGIVAIGNRGLHLTVTDTNLVATAPKIPGQPRQDALYSQTVSSLIYTHN